MNEKIILHLCADIGSDSKPYRENGYNVILIGKNIGVENYHPPPNVYGIIANPPCTMFSIARTNAETPRDMKQGMNTVYHCLRIIWESQYYMVEKHVPHKLKFWAIENPATGYLKHYLGMPAFQYCPSEYGSKYSKRTALWGHFNQPAKPFMVHPIQKTECLARDKPPSKYATNEERMHERSMCYESFATAFYLANQ